MSARPPTGSGTGPMRWADRAACARRPGLAWVQDRVDLPGGVMGRAVVAQMAAVCAACPVLAECSARAVTESGGYWAGAWRHESAAAATEPGTEPGPAAVSAQDAAPAATVGPAVVGWVPFTRPGRTRKTGPGSTGSGGGARWEQSLITFGGAA
jgi:hypothetical protein